MKPKLSGAVSITILTFASAVFSGHYITQVLYLSQDGRSGDSIAVLINDSISLDCRNKTKLHVRAIPLQAQDCPGAVVIHFGGSPSISFYDSVRACYGKLKGMVNSEIRTEDDEYGNHSRCGYSVLVDTIFGRETAAVSMTKEESQGEFGDSLWDFFGRAYGENSLGGGADSYLHPLYFSDQIPKQKPSYGRSTFTITIKDATRSKGAWYDQIWVWTFPVTYEGPVLKEDRNLAKPIYLGVWKDRRHVYGLVVHPDKKTRDILYGDLRRFVRESSK